MAKISLQNIRKVYPGGVEVVPKLNLEIADKEFVVLVGPSGCGKSTTLRMIAGLEEITDGDMYIGERRVNDVAPKDRNIAMVFQSYALFPHLSVYENVAFGLKLRKMEKAEMDRKIKEILEVCDLTEYAQRFPKQLSGGQRQRVALARALVIEPRLLLLDEPLSNLDAKLRLNMRVEIKRLQKKLGITTVFVTHDQEECFSISDKVAVMNGGVIEQFGTPEEIYSRPKTEFVARFIGFENFIQLRKTQENTYRANDGSLFTAEMDCGKDECLGTIRPDDIQIVTNGEAAGNTVTAKIEVRTYLGKSYQYELSTPIGRLVVNDGSGALYKAGDTITIQLPAAKIVLV